MRLSCSFGAFLLPLLGLSSVPAAHAAVAAPVTAAGPAATGPQGQVVTVSRSQGLDPAGTAVTVTGRGFDLSKGIYVAFCVNRGAGQLPSPCLGGVDMEGSSGASQWISSNPPSYGEGLATPYTTANGKGSFQVRLRVSAKDQFTNCLDRKVAPNGCAISTRADHTRTADRTADVLVPVTFAGGVARPTPTASASQPTEQPSGPSAQPSGSSEESPTGQQDQAGPPVQRNGGPLASTGGTALAILVAAVVLLIGGATALVASRRRRSEPAPAGRTTGAPAARSPEQSPGRSSEQSPEQSPEQSSAAKEPNA